MLPQKFTERMQSLLGQEYAAFETCLLQEPRRSLRINTLKSKDGQGKDILSVLPFSLSPVPWAETGYYYEEEEQPGRHPFHQAGLYYIQEASAMAPVTFLEAKPGERILDLCAAPGGKSTQIACAMKGKGTLVCNEIHPARARILSENIERMGIPNALVLNETPERLSDRFEEYFDRILVDAPCSGEGMFRKNDAACEEWSEENVQLCAERQAKILDAAAGMLKPGGRLVYSTCTFAPEENEGSISRFLERHPEFELLFVPLTGGMEPGRGEWTEHPAKNIGYTIRLWPHKVQGEGHFVAVLEKQGAGERLTEGFCRYGQQKGLALKNFPQLQDFYRETFCAETICPETFCTEALCTENRDTDRTSASLSAADTAFPGTLVSFGEQLYLAPADCPCMDKLKVLRAGLQLGTIKKNRFEPSHALALAVKPEEVRHTWTLSVEQPEVLSYLHGQTLPAEGEKGWYLVTAEGFGLGWGKLAGGILKNHYPKGLRIQY